MNEEYIRCEICGKEMRRIANFHLRLHGISVSEYREMFPNAPLSSENWKNKLKKARRSIGKYELSRLGKIGGDVLGDRMRGKTFEECFGREYSVKRRKNHSIGATKRQKKGKSHLYSDFGYVNGIKYESSYEKRFIHFCILLGVEIKRCNFCIPYECEGVLRRYLPDFVILNNGEVEAIVEVTCDYFAENLENFRRGLKFNALKKYCAVNSIKACLYTEKVFNFYGNHEPSSVKSFVVSMERNLNRFVTEKVQRLEIEEKDANKISTAPDDQESHSEILG